MEQKRDKNKTIILYYVLAYIDTYYTIIFQMHAQRSSYPFTIQQKFLSIHNFPHKQKHTHIQMYIVFN